LSEPEFPEYANIISPYPNNPLHPMNLGSDNNALSSERNALMKCRRGKHRTPWHSCDRGSSGGSSKRCFLWQIRHWSKYRKQSLAAIKNFALIFNILAKFGWQGVKVLNIHQNWNIAVLYFF
jgi:hypothetical protein